MPRLGRGRPVEPLIVIPRATGTTAAFATVSLSGGGSLTIADRKGSSVGVVLTGGGSVSTSARKMGLRAALFPGGGSLTVSAKKIGLANPTVSGGGTSSTTAKKTVSAALALSGGGSVTTQSARPSQGIFVTVVVGGGGRLGRGHPVMAPSPRTALVPPYAPNTSATISGGGSQTVTWRTSRSGSVALSGGGDASVSGNGLQQPQVITVVIGGGGRLGRSFPVRAITPTGRARVFAPNDKDHSGSMSMTGGGSVSVSGKKGGLSETLGNPMAPPMFLIFNSGVVLRGGGTVSATGTAQIRTGNARLSGGGTILVAGRKTAKGSLALPGGGQLGTQGAKFVVRATSLSGGGALVTAGRKSGRSGLTLTGGGLLTTTYVLRAKTSLAQPFNVNQPVGVSLAQLYTTSTAGSAGASLGMPFLRDKAVGASLGIPSGVSQLVGRSLGTTFGTRSIVGASLAQSYSAGSLTTVGLSAAFGYIVTVARGTSLAQPYQLGGSAGRSLAQPFRAFTLQLDVTEQIFTHIGATKLLSDNRLISVQEETLEVVPV